MDFEVYVDPDTGDEYTAEEIDAINPALRQSARPEPDPWSTTARRGMESFNGWAGEKLDNGFDFLSDLLPDVDLTAYVRRGESQPPTEGFFPRTGKRIFGAIGEAAGNFGGGGMRLISDQFPDNAITDYLEDKGRIAQETGSRINQIMERTGTIDRSTLGGEASDTVSRALASLAPMVPGLIAGPAALATGFAGQTAGREYGTLLDEGVDSGKAQQAAITQGLVDGLGGFLLPHGSGMMKATPGLKEYLATIPRTAATLAGFNTLAGATKEFTNQNILQDTPLDEVDYQKVGAEGVRAGTSNLGETGVMSAILGPLGLGMGARRARPIEAETGPRAYEFSERAEPTSGQTSEAPGLPAPEFSLKGEPYTPDILPAVQEPTLPQSLTEAYNRRAATLGEQSAAFAPRVDLADAAPKGLQEGSRIVPDTLPAIQEPTLGQRLAEAYARKVAARGEESAAFMPRADMDAPVPAVIPENPISTRSLSEAYARSAVRYGEEGAARLTKLVSPKDPTLDSWLPAPYQPSKIDPSKAVPGVTYSPRIAAADSGSSFPVPFSERASKDRSSRVTASLSKDLAPSGTSSDSISQPGSAEISVPKMRFPVDDLTPANVTPLPERTNQAVSPVSELRNVPAVSMGSIDVIEGKPVDYNSAPVSPSTIVARPDLMQHREGANAVTGVTPDRALTGEKFERQLSGPLVVWDPMEPAKFGLDVAKGETSIIADGHHRLDLAKRLDAPFVDVLRLKESDGFTAEDARRIAAERNIASESAKFVDQLKFFRETDRKLGREVALARAKQLGAKGKNARTVAFDGSDLLVREVTRGVIDDKAATIIAEAAPRDEAAQGRAIQMVKEGETAQAATAFLRLSQDAELVAALKAPAGGATTPDMFGASTGRDKVMSLARMVEDVKKELRDTLAGNRQALKNRKSGLAEREGLDVDKSTEDLKARVETVRDLYDVSELIATKTVVRNEAIKLMDENLPRETFVQRLADFISKMKGDETGAIPNPARAIKSAQDRLADILNPKLKGKDWKEQELHPSEMWLKGMVFGRKVPGFSQALAANRAVFSRMQTVLPKHPKAREVWELMGQKAERRSEIEANFRQQLAPAYDLIDTKPVARALASAREGASEAAKLGKTIIVNDQTLAAIGLTPAQIEAHNAVRRTLDDAFEMAKNATLQSWREKLRDDPNPTKLAEKLSETEKFFFEKKQSHYFPIQRFGNHFVYAENPTTGETFYNLYESKREATGAANNLNERGYTVGRTGEVREILADSYHDMPPELSLELQGLAGEPDPPKMKVGGFKAHLLHAKLVPGYEAQLKRNVSQYVKSLARYVSDLEFDAKINDAHSAIDNRNPMYKVVDNYIKHNKKPGWEGRLPRTLMAIDAMGFSVQSAALNATQALTSVYPELSRRTRSPEKALFAAMRKTRLLSKNPEAFAQKYPDLYRDIVLAEKRGLLERSSQYDLSEREAPLEKFTDLSMTLTRMTGQWTRRVAFVAGHDSARSEDKFRSAADFTQLTNFDTTSVNKPAVARGLGAPFLIFKQFGFNMLGNIKDTVADILLARRAKLDPTARAQYDEANARFDRQFGGERSLWRYAASIGLLGGYKAIPFIKDILGLAAANGVDLNDEFRESMGDDTLSSMLMYGPTIFGGAQLTGSLSSELFPTEQGLVSGAAQFVGGYPYSFIKRAERAAQSYKTYGSMGRAAMELAPRAPRNLATAYLWMTEGAAKDTKGRTVMKDPTPAEIALKALSFNPSRYALAQEKSRSIQMLDEGATAETAGLRNQIAVALELGDRERAIELLERAAEIGVNVTEKQIEEQMLQNQDPAYRQLKAVPKRKRDEAARIINPR